MASPALIGGNGGDAVGLFTVVHGGRVRGSSAAETWEAEAAHKEKIFSPGEQPSSGARASGGCAVSIREGFMPHLDEALSSPV